MINEAKTYSVNALFSEILFFLLLTSPLVLLKIFFSLTEAASFFTLTGFTKASLSSTTSKFSTICNRKQTFNTNCDTQHMKPLKNALNGKVSLIRAINKTWKTAMITNPRLKISMIFKLTLASMLWKYVDNALFNCLNVDSVDIMI